MVYSTGSNLNGQLGLGDDTTDRCVPALINVGMEFSSMSIVAVAVGYDHALIASSTGTVYATGANSNGQLGCGDLVNRDTPILISNVGRVYARIAAGRGHSMLVSTDGRVYAMGLNSYGELGLGDWESRFIPTLLPATTTTTTFSAVSTGFFFSMLLSLQGLVFFTGDNQYGQLGVGDTANRCTPTLSTVGTKILISAIAAGNYHSLMLAAGSGAVYCAGENSYGQQGLGDSVVRFTPTLLKPAIARITAIAGGGFYSMLLSEQGMVYVCGLNAYGQLGIGDTLNRYSPTLMDPLTSVAITSLAAGNSHSLLLSRTNLVFSAGLNINGELGLGDRLNRWTPTLIATSGIAVAVSGGLDSSYIAATPNFNQFFPNTDVCANENKTQSILAIVLGTLCGIALLIIVWNVVKYVRGKREAQRNIRRRQNSISLVVITPSAEPVPTAPTLEEIQ